MGWPSQHALGALVQQTRNPFQWPDDAGVGKDMCAGVDSGQARNLRCGLEAEHRGCLDARGRRIIIHFVWKLRKGC